MRTVFTPLRAIFIIILVLILAVWLLLNARKQQHVDQSFSTTTSQGRETIINARGDGTATKDASGASELSNITPGFVGRTGDVIADNQSPDLKKIKEDAIRIVSHNASSPAQRAWYDEHIYLRGVGHRYVLMSVAKESGGYDIVVDFVKATSKQVTDAGTPSYTAKNTAIYVTGNKIYYYKIDSSDVAVLPNSVLSKQGETYHAGDQDMALDPKLTVTYTTLSISVFDSTTFHQNPNDPSDPGASRSSAMSPSRFHKHDPRFRARSAHRGGVSPKVWYSFAGTAIASTPLSMWHRGIHTSMSH